VHTGPRVEAWVRLHAAALPARALVALLRAFGTAEAVFAARPAERRRAAPDAAAALERRIDGTRVDAALGWLAEPGHHLVAWDDGDYPPALLALADPPPVLFAVGRRALLDHAAFAIVGSRHGTAQGCRDAEAFAHALSDAGFSIVSGLALGIDAAAHRGGLAGASSSIAIMGTGPDRIYPARNRDLAHALADRGLLLTEFGPGAPPLPDHFPRRNRIISGLARGLLVVEATLSSGSLITARLAGDQGRDVFAIPGSIHSPFSRGCHRLIREGAKLVETAQDVLEELGAARSTLSTRSDPATIPAVTADGGAVLSALGHDPLDLDTIVHRTRLTVDAVNAQLATLEIDGHVAALPGGRWQRLA